MENYHHAPDSSLTLIQYWNKHKLVMANNHNWICHGTCGNLPECQRYCQDKLARTNNPGTLHDYNRYVHLVDQKLTRAISISELSVFDIFRAIGLVREEQNWSTSTAGVLTSVIHDIFRFAADRGDAADILQCSTASANKLNLPVLLGNNHPEDYVRHALRKERERLAHTTKSLTIWQLEKLSSLLWDLIKNDGRYCLIVLMVYTGVRPAEGRALRWKDIVPFVDHPDRELINCYHIRDANGKLQKRLKTSNAYRRIPVHMELAAYLHKRYQYVLAHSSQPIDDFPICCFGNDFVRPCQDFEAAALAQKLLKDEVALSTDDMYAYQIMQLSEHFDSSQTERDDTQNLTLYVLRRNFWTWLQASTTLSDSEKRLIMGHDLEETESRKAENDENLLWSICQQMDHCIISRDRHLPYLHVTPTPGVPVSVCNQGAVHIRLTKEMLARGVELSISVTNEEIGDTISLMSLSPVRHIGSLSPHVQITAMPPLPSKRGINCDYELLQAHRKPIRPNKSSKANNLSN